MRQKVSSPAAAVFATRGPCGGVSEAFKKFQHKIAHAQIDANPSRDGHKLLKPIQVTLVDSHISLLSPQTDIAGRPLLGRLDHFT
jgi:hypothetical protein